MKAKILPIIFILCCTSLRGQIYCSYSGGQCTQGLSPATNYAQRVVSNVCDILDIDYIDTYQGSVGNACASSYRGEPIITYNSGFLNFLSSRNTWAPISVLAHEVGHHYYLDATVLGAFQHSWTKELRADFVAGYVLQKMGASLNDAQSAFYVMFDWMGNRSHPNTPRRMQALAQGYYQAYQGY